MTRRRCVHWLGACLISLCILGVVRTAAAHEIDSATLTLTELSPGLFLMRFHAASATLQRESSARAVFPKPCRVFDPYLECGAAGLVGRIAFPWLPGTLTRLMVEIDWQSGARQLRVVSASSPELTVYGVPASGFAALEPIFFDYTRLGVEHIWTGFDHLLFVIALAILVRSRRSLIATVTAFTVAHSLTLAATALGFVSVPAAPVEATIALSIVLVCAECLRPGASLTQRAPWLVAFVFGLLHGLGFASALLDIGLPEAHLPAALFSFNLGVELGQLAVIASLLTLRALIARSNVCRAWRARTVIYAMGGIAAYWSIDRVLAVFSG